jgi:DHA1 family inner membrane transport protein
MCLSLVMTRPKPKAARAIDRPAALIALLLVATVTEAMFMLLPSFVGALGDVLHLSASRTGLLGSADLAGIAVATGTAPWWLRRVPWRGTVLISLTAFLVINLVCLDVGAFWPLLVLRVLAGLAAGVAYPIALAGVLDTARADRNTGLMVSLQVIFGAVGVFAIDAVRMDWRLDAFYFFLAAWLLAVLIISARWYPDNPGDRPPSGPIAWRALAGRGALVTMGTGLYFLMIGAVWGYLEGIAREAGLSLEQTGTALSSGLVVSLLGSGAATWLGLRFGRARPLIASAVVQVASLALLTRLSHYADPVAAFFVINSVFQIVWSYVIAYFIIIFNDVDSSGRFVAVYGTASHLTLAVGPYVGALLIVNHHYTPLLWFGVIAVSACYACFLAAVWLGRAAADAPRSTTSRGLVHGQD